MNTRNEPGCLPIIALLLGLCAVVTPLAWWLGWRP